MPDDAIDVLVCTTCRSTAPSDASPLTAEPEIRAGAQLYAALTQAPAPEGVTIRAVECLSNCNRGCTVALRGGNRWSYVYGNLDPQTHVQTVLDGASRYRNAADGLVPWRERPEHFRKNCIARIPPLTLPETA